MKKQTILKITNDDGTSETIPCYLQLSQLFKVPHSVSWKGRYNINGKRKWFSSPLIDGDDAWRDVNKQINDFVLKGKRNVIKRNEYPSLLKVVNAMLAEPYAIIEIKEGARFQYAKALVALTKHLPGKEPEWEWVDEARTIRQFKEGSKWDKINTNDLAPGLVRNFRAEYTKGLPVDGDTYNIRGRGANTVLKDAKSVFGKKLMKVVYEPRWKMPDMTEFKEMEKMNVTDAVYSAPQADFMDNFLTKLAELKSTCVETWLTFILSYAAGFRWAEIRNAHWSWLYPETGRNASGEVVERYVIEVQPTENWKPKANSVGKVYISKSAYDDIMSTREISRDKVPNMSLTELQQLVWSIPGTQAAKQMNLSPRGLALRCGRLGIQTPPNGFWRRVETGKIPHPNGTPPEGVARVEPNVIPFEEEKRGDGPILQRYRGDGKSASSANRRLAKWMRDLGWARRYCCHEMRKLNGAMIVTNTGSIYEAQKSLRHGTYRTTEKHYADLIAKSDYTVEIPKAS